MSKFLWKINERGYIWASIDNEYTRLHRLVMNLSRNDGYIVDHIDRNPLNNKKSNLRLCTNMQNSRNRSLNNNSTSYYKGVCFDKDTESWKSQISINKKKVYIGRYNTAIEEAIEYDRCAASAFGDFANLNFDISNINHYLINPISIKKTKIKSSIYYGVTYYKYGSKWRVVVKSKGVGYFKTEKEAALAVDSYIIKNNLDKSKLNFPECEVS